MPSEQAVNALNRFFEAFGTKAAYCVELDRSGAIQFVVCFGGNFTDRRLSRTLSLPGIAQAFREVPVVRLIATNIGDTGVRDLLKVNHDMEVMVVSCAQWKANMDEFNRLRTIRYGAWPKPAAPSGAAERGPARYGLGPC